MNPSSNYYSHRRAGITTAIFLTAGVFGVVWTHDLAHSVFQIIFYALMVLNAYFSISHFAAIIPANDKTQGWMDAGLVLCYILLAVSITRIVAFNLILLVLYIFASLKYILALPITPRPELLYRKIKIDTFGILACALATIAILVGYGRSAFIAWTVVFLLATIYVLYIKPLYK